MSNANQLLYFVSQTYRQVQLSVAKGTVPYPYSQFAHQFDCLLNASDDEAQVRHLTIRLVEEAATYEETTDYLRREMDFETKAAAHSIRDEAMSQDEHRDNSDLTARRLHRQQSH